MEYPPRQDQNPQGQPSAHAQGYFPGRQSAPPQSPPPQPQPPQSDPFAAAYSGYQPQPQPQPPQYAPPQNDPFAGAYASYQPPQLEEEAPQEDYPPQPAPYVAPEKIKKRHAGPGVYILISALVLAAAAIIVARLMDSSQTYVSTVRAGSLGAQYAGDALIVRNEAVYSQEEVTQIKYVAAEGQAVRRGDEICKVYNSGYSAKEITSLNAYRQQIRDYQLTLIASESTVDTKLSRLQTDVLSRAAEARTIIQTGVGDLLGQETLLTKAMEEWQYYLKQKYPDDQKLARLYDNENSQLQRIETWSKQYNATADGLVSFYTDGYEGALNAVNWADYTPAQVRDMVRGVLPSTGEGSVRATTPIYRLVRQSAWYVLLLCSDPDWVPVIGRSYKLLIESYDNSTVDATVVSFTRMGGEMLVRLEVTGDVSPVLYIRSCRVQLGETIISLTVPSSALFTQNGQIGVVVILEQGQYFVPVNVIQQEGSNAHIVAVNEGFLYEGQKVLLFR